LKYSDLRILLFKWGDTLSSYSSEEEEEEEEEYLKIV